MSKAKELMNKAADLVIMIGMKKKPVLKESDRSPAAEEQHEEAMQQISEEKPKKKKS